MALAMRIPTVEFRSLLLPPVRVPLRALQTLYRPQCAFLAQRPPCPAQRLEQRRALNLYKTAKATTVLGQHKILNFTPYLVEETAPLEKLEDRVKLWATNKDGKKTGVISESISLQELYDEHVKDGRILYCLTAIEKGLAKTHLGDEKLEIPEELREFSITKAHTFKGPPTLKQSKTQIGGLKNIIFNESSPVNFFRLVMDRAYQFIENGLAVEFRLRLQGKQLLKEERIKPAGPERWTWMHTHFPHLRPDFIMKAMPPGTRYLINPVSDGRHIQWVAVLSEKKGPVYDLDQRLMKIKASVSSSIKQGRQAMLPKIMRQQLREQGLEDYSINTGLPREMAREKHGRVKRQVYSGEEKKWLARDAETDRFLQPDEDAELEIRKVDPHRKTDRWDKRGYTGRQK